MRPSLDQGYRRPFCRIHIHRSSRSYVLGCRRRVQTCRHFACASALQAPSYVSESLFQLQLLLEKVRVCSSASGGKCWDASSMLSLVFLRRLLHWLHGDQYQHPEGSQQGTSRRALAGCGGIRPAPSSAISCVRPCSGLLTFLAKSVLFLSVLRVLARASGTRCRTTSSDVVSASGGYTRENFFCQINGIRLLELPWACLALVVVLLRLVLVNPVLNMFRKERLRSIVAAALSHATTLSNSKNSRQHGVDQVPRETDGLCPSWREQKW